MFFGVSPEEASPFALTVDPYWILVSLVQFLILYYLLRRFLWGPVTKTLEDGPSTIALPVSPVFEPPSRVDQVSPPPVAHSLVTKIDPLVWTAPLSGNVPE